MPRAERLAPALACALLLLVVSAPARAADYSAVVAVGNRIGVTLTNSGVIGNNFATRAASLEYPLGTGYEHLPHAGLWIGAQATDGSGGFTGVTTAMLDAAVGTSTNFYTEFTPAATGLLRRSLLVTSPYYHQDAVSELDAIALFDDATPRTTSGNPESHRPLHVAVRQISHQWSHGDKDDLAIQRFVIHNAGAFALTNVYVGLYAELASGPKNAYSTWPPSSGGSVYGSWFSKKLLAWDGGSRLLREHRCQSQPIPGGCAFEVTPAWMGLELLTPPAAWQDVTVAVWNYAPYDPSRDEDIERYGILSAGTIADVTAEMYLPGTGDPVELLALGPFSSIAPGDSIEVAFALVGGAEVADILESALTAQRLHDADYNGMAVGVDAAPAAPRLRLVPLTSPLPAGAIVLAVELPEAGSPTLELIDAAGRRVARRELGLLGPGRHIVRLDEAAGWGSGIYFARLRSGREIASSRIVMLR